MVNGTAAYEYTAGFQEAEVYAIPDAFIMQCADPLKIAWIGAFFPIPSAENLFHTSGFEISFNRKRSR